jgi:hypothetical protein
MVADAITGNISPEATTQAGNIFADATRGVCSLLFLMNFFVSLDLAPQNVDALGVLYFRSDCRKHAFYQ